MADHTLKLVKIDHIGIEMFLGALEVAILRALWDNRQTTRAIYKHVEAHYKPVKTDDLAFTSITSTVDRLRQRGLVTRTGDRSEYKYKPTYASERDFVDRCLRAVLGALFEAYPREVSTIVISHIKAAAK